jgi:hypothetical protein
MPLSSAAREKLRRLTMSQKILRDLRFIACLRMRPRAALQAPSFRLVLDEKSE